VARTKGARNADYDAKRQELLERLLPRFVDRAKGRPSFRQFAAAAGVTMPTLRHYFGDRADVVAAVLQDFHRQANERMEMIAAPAAGFAPSVREYAMAFVAGMQCADGPVRLGDVFAASLSEGLADPEISPIALRYVIDPALEALERRLAVHVARGEMRETDLRAAALMLIAPILVAVLHQDQMRGAASCPMVLNQVADDVAGAFIRAYAAERADQAALAG
jgi:AcrR family transcriptional regulator